MTDTIATIAKQTNTILLAFSCGKDSLAAWLECQKHFRRIIPFYLYLVPDLQFVERSLSYYEQFFGCRIARYPHPSLYRMLRHGIFQAPQNIRTIERAQLPEFDYADIYRIVRQANNLPDTAYCASGVRAIDSPYRMIAIRKYGAINHKAKQFYPIWDWRQERLIREIRDAHVKLPVDYRLFGRSFDGIDYRFLAPLAKHYPEDYRKILEWFPLAELELRRRGREYGS